LKLLQKIAGSMQEAIDIGNCFHCRTQIVEKLRERIDKLEYMKLKAFIQQKYGF
jgi:hypothetical protein